MKKTYQLIDLTKNLSTGSLVYDNDTKTIDVKLFDQATALADRLELVVSYINLKGGHSITVTNSNNSLLISGVNVEFQKALFQELLTDLYVTPVLEKREDQTH